MEYRTLTGTGALVSRISLGSFFTFGGQLAEDDAIRMVHRAIEAHRGAILVDGNVGRGARFTVYLPAHTHGRRN